MNTMLPMNIRPAKGTKTPRTSAEELRNAGDWMANVLTDYCSCMAHERAAWLVRAASVREAILALPYCPRASASDREYVERMLVRLDEQVAKVTRDLAALEAQKAAARPAVLRLIHGT